MDHQVIMTLGLIFLVGTLAQWIGWRLKFPVIVLLLFSGALLGPVTGVIDPEKVFGDLLTPVVELGVAIILFEGGLQLRLYEFQEVSKGLNRLFTLGVLFNWILGTLAAHYVGDLSWGISFLIAGILVVTGPTVIIPALREAKLSRRLGNFLKWEGIISDPIGAILAVIAFEFLVYGQQQGGFAFISITLLKVIMTSVVFVIFIRALVMQISQKALLPEYLKIPFYLTLVLCSFVFSNMIQSGAGLLTVTLLGLIIGNLSMTVVEDLKKFEEYISTFTVSCIFIILSASIDLSIFTKLELKHIALILLFAFVIRPVAIMLSTYKSGMTFRERSLVGLFGPRGIVAASMAGLLGNSLTREGFVEGSLILPIIFSIIIITVVIHGMMLKPLAKWLKLSKETRKGVVIIGTSPWITQLAMKLKSMEIPVLLTSASWYMLSPARQLGIDVYCGQILDDAEQGKVDLSYYEFLLAFSENDTFNSLACHKLSHTFGRDNCYRLPQHENQVHDKIPEEKDPYNLSIDPKVPYFENMVRYYHWNWKFKETKLSDKFKYTDFLKENGDTIVFLIIRSGGRVDFFHSSKRMIDDPKEGDVIISYNPKIKNNEGR